MTDHEKLDELVAELVKESFGPSYREYVFFYFVTGDKITIKVVGMFDGLSSSDHFIQVSAVFTVKARIDGDKLVVEEVS